MTINIKKINQGKMIIKQIIYNIKYKKNVFEDTTSVGHVFSSKEKAEKWIKEQPCSDMYDIEELQFSFNISDLKEKKKKEIELLPIGNLIHESMTFDDLHIYTVDLFIECVKDGFFTDYDGSGCPVYETKDGLFYEDKSIDLDTITKKKNLPFTKVVWFNR